LGDFVQQVAQSGGVSLVTASVSGSYNNRRIGYMTGAQYTLDTHFTGDRPTATVGGAFSWRLKEAPPGVTGGPGLTLFSEGIGHYEGDHSGWLAIAPGFVFRAGETQLKGGIRLPFRRWNTTSPPMVSLSTSIFVKVGH
jgi:hypothetical protein